MRKTKKQNGITLIALIITIIVLLILAVVAISAVTGTGIIQHAKNATSEYQKKVKEENEVLQGYVDKIEENIPGGTDDSKNDELEITKTVKDLKVGEYVNYIDKEGNTVPCMVLYDSDDGFGIQIITLDVLGTYSLGRDEDWEYEASLPNYNGAISSLNAYTMNIYMNEVVSSDARSVGSVPNDKNSESDYITGDTFATYFGEYKDQDTNYEKDVSRLEELEILVCSSEYWLASREIINGYFKEFCIRTVSPNNNGLDQGSLISFDISGEQGGSIYQQFYLRPVFTLINEIEILNGTGEKDFPYELKY